MSRLAPQPRAKAATKQPRRVWLVVRENGKVFAVCPTKHAATCAAQQESPWLGVPLRVVGPYVLEKP